MIFEKLYYLKNLSETSEIIDTILRGGNNKIKYYSSKFYNLVRNGNFNTSSNQEFEICGFISQHVRNPRHKLQTWLSCHPK